MNKFVISLRVKPQSKTLSRSQLGFRTRSIESNPNYLKYSDDRQYDQKEDYLVIAKLTTLYKVTQVFSSFSKAYLVSAISPDLVTYLG